MTLSSAAMRSTTSTQSLTSAILKGLSSASPARATNPLVMLVRTHVGAIKLTRNPGLLGPRMRSMLRSDQNSPRTPHLALL